MKCERNLSQGYHEKLSLVKTRIEISKIKANFEKRFTDLKIISLKCLGMPVQKFYKNLSSVIKNLF